MKTTPEMLIEKEVVRAEKSGSTFSGAAWYASGMIDMATVAGVITYAQQDAFMVRINAIGVRKSG